MTRARDTAGIIQYNKITVDSNNAVGIGSSIPDCKLDINGGLRVVGVSTFEDAVNVNADMTIDGAGNNLRLNDNSVLELGTSNDFNIFHDGSVSIIRDGGTGGLLIDSDNEIKLAKNGAGNDSMAVFTVDGSAELYYDNSKKFETTGIGITVTGAIHADGLSVGDDERINVGISSDLQIYHNGTDSYVEDTGTGALILKGSFIRLHSNAGENMLTGAANGAVQLMYDNGTKLATTTTGIDVTGEVLGDSLDIDGVADISGNVTLSGTGSIKVPAGTTAERPSATAGMLRYNSDDGAFEGYTSEWGSIGGFSKTQTWLFGAG